MEIIGLLFLKHYPTTKKKTNKQTNKKQKQNKKQNKTKQNENLFKGQFHEMYAIPISTFYLQWVQVNLNST